MKIQKLTNEYLDRCIEIHQDAFKGFFLTFLGPNFLKVLYESIANDPSGIAYFILHDDKVLGFVIGTTNVNNLYKRLMLKNWFKFGMASIKPFMMKPVIIFRLLRALTLPVKELSPPNTATLMSIAINPAYQGFGIGKFLMSAFFEEAYDRGCKSVILTTDAENNEKTNIFYQKIGFDLYKAFSTPEGRKMNEYLIKL